MVIVLTCQGLEDMRWQADISVLRLMCPEQWWSKILTVVRAIIIKGVIIFDIQSRLGLKANT